MTAIEWLIREIEEKYNFRFGNFYWYEIQQAKEIENIEKLKRQLFIGKVSEIIGMDKTIELWKECIETFK